MSKYAYRLETRRIKEPDFPYSGKIRFTKPDDVAEFARKMEEFDIEKMIVLLLNAQNKLIGFYVIAGTVDQSTVYQREIVKHTLLSGASALVLIHNHPSGNVQASPEDITVTKRIIACADLFGVRVLDHIVIGTEGQYCSFREKGLISK
jgi:DNA repair protein RadC